MPLSSNSSPDRAGRLFVVSGPSGVGKSTLVRLLADRRPLAFSVSATTRPPRPGEVDGVDYHFVGDSRFDELLEEDELLEWAEYGGHRYGTPRAALLNQLNAGRDVVLDIEEQGARQIRARFPQAILIFIAPPDLTVLETRLRARGDTDPTQIERRLAIAARQIEEAPGLFDYLVTNGQLETAAAHLNRIVEAGERPKRNAG